MDIKEIAVQATGSGILQYTRPDDKVSLVIVTPHIVSVVFERNGSEHTLQVEHLDNGHRWQLRPGNRVEAKDYV